MNVLTPTNLLVGIAYIFTQTVGAEAAPYCPELLEPEQLETKYQRLAPIYSDDQTGWIFTSDQLEQEYDLKSETEYLLTEIVAEFDARGIELALMVAPPRVVVAGQTVVDSAMIGTDKFDTGIAMDSFARMLEQLRETGAVVPDLLTPAMASHSDQPYYYARDTHWTPAGAAISALALAKELGIPTPAYKVEDVSSEEFYHEKGSLSAIIDVSCEFRPAPESSVIMDFSAIYAELNIGLFSDTPADAIALLGTSFSDRNKRDQYQVADAISAATGRDVHNYSVSGGGLIGPIEAFVLSGELASADYSTVVWEFPYTEAPPSTSQLRQLLGALRVSEQMTPLQLPLELDETNQAKLFVDGTNGTPNLMKIETEDTDLLSVDLIVEFVSGGTKKVKMRRKSRIPAERRSTDWWADLTGWSNREISNLTLSFPSDINQSEIYATQYFAGDGT